MIVAVSKHFGIGGIGFQNKLPWYLKGDLQYFKKKTIGSGNNAIVMGKNTWLSLPKCLPKRDFLILIKSIQKGDNGYFFSSINAMKAHCKEKKYDEVWIIGGESIYKQMIHDKDLYKICVTDIDKLYDVDTYFPTLPHYFSLSYYSNKHYENNISYTHNEYVNLELNKFTGKLTFPRYGGIPENYRS